MTMHEQQDGFEVRGEHDGAHRRRGGGAHEGSGAVGKRSAAAELGAVDRDQQIETRLVAAEVQLAELRSVHLPRLRAALSRHSHHEALSARAHVERSLHAIAHELHAARRKVAGGEVRARWMALDAQFVAVRTEAAPVLAQAPRPSHHHHHEAPILISHDVGVDDAALVADASPSTSIAKAFGGGHAEVHVDPEPYIADARATIDPSHDAPASAIQRFASTTTTPENQNVQAHAARGIAGPSTPLPYLDAIQRSFGPHDVSHVQAHVGGAATAASRAIGADAYATGDHVAFASEPSLFLVAHEAAHVVQQRGGVQLSGGVGQAGDRYEQHADAVAERVVRGESAAELLDESTASTARTDKSVQRQAVADTGAQEATVHPVIADPATVTFGEMAVTDKVPRTAMLRITNRGPGDTGAEIDYPSFQGTNAASFDIDPSIGWMDAERVDVDKFLIIPGTPARVSLRFQAKTMGPNRASLVLNVKMRDGRTQVVSVPVEGLGREDGYEVNDQKRDDAAIAAVAAQEEQRIRDAGKQPVSDKKVKTVAAESYLTAIPERIAAIGENQRVGASRAHRDLKQKDPPTLLDRLVDMAVKAALTQVFGFLGQMGAQIVQGILDSRKEEPSDTAIAISRELHRRLLAVALAHIKPEEEATSIDRFFGQQLDALRIGAQHAQRSFSTELMPLLVTADDADAQIEALYKGVDEEADGAEGVQYMESISAWADLLVGGTKYHSAESSPNDPNPLGVEAGSKGELVVKLKKLASPDAPVVIVSKEFGGISSRANKAIKTGRTAGREGDTDAGNSDVASRMTPTDLHIVVRIEFKADDANGIERDHAIEVYPDDIRPVYGNETEKYLGLVNLDRIVSTVLRTPVGGR